MWMWQNLSCAFVGSEVIKPIISCEVTISVSMGIQHPPGLIVPGLFRLQQIHKKGAQKESMGRGCGRGGSRNSTLGDKAGIGLAGVVEHGEEREDPQGVVVVVLVPRATSM